MRKMLQVVVVAALFPPLAAISQSADAPPSKWATTPCDIVSAKFRDECLAEHERLGIPPNASPNNPTGAEPGSGLLSEAEMAKRTAARRAELAKIREATPTEQRWIRKGLESALKDAESARLRNVMLIPADGATTICGEVNAKNSFGAYAGFSAFTGVLSPESKTAVIAKVDSDDRIAADMCRLKMT